MRVTLRDRVRNERVRRELGVEFTVTDMIQKKRNRWFRHVVRKPQDEYVVAPTMKTLKTQDREEGLQRDGEIKYGRTRNCRYKP